MCSRGGKICDYCNVNSGGKAIGGKSIQCIGYANIGWYADLDKELKILACCMGRETCLIGEYQ